tara:strand:+ start:42 stop:677 length:636 start_codon:yes stop_codon:yes gene_type:complete
MTFTIEKLSKMTMVEIMNEMNSMKKEIIDLKENLDMSVKDAMKDLTLNEDKIKELEEIVKESGQHGLKCVLEMEAEITKLKEEHKLKINKEVKARKDLFTSEDLRNRVEDLNSEFIIKHNKTITKWRRNHENYEKMEQENKRLTEKLKLTEKINKKNVGSMDMTIEELEAEIKNSYNDLEEEQNKHERQENRITVLENKLRTIKRTIGNFK